MPKIPASTKLSDRGLLSVVKEFLFSVPAIVGETIKGKAAAYSSSSQLREERVNLDWNEASALNVYSEIEDLLRRSGQGRKEEQMVQTGECSFLNPEEELIAKEIAARTQSSNISNLSRTKAYWECYQIYPELHWAFLAHMVSRNGGWNMSDLRGGQMYPLLDEASKEAVYRFLERSNALIFQDAYPQLLLYIKSRELGRSLFHLLPYFHVSRFMQPFWDKFWLERGSALLTVGLIINEQNYIERRVVQQPYFQQRVTDKASFHIHNLAGLNQVILPMLDQQDVRMPCALEEQPLRLAGRILSDFTSLTTRISFGKSLYALLFGLPALRKGTEAFASRIPHTGSRADYWPSLFTTRKEEALTASLEESTLLGKDKLPLGQRLYAPVLLEAWGDTPYEPINREDWMQDHRALDGLSKPESPYLCDISYEHRLGILKTAIAHDAANI
ncbi:hypothetical protein J2Z69_003121 [Paenibacillus shirakamiensis]|uniref:DUF2515 domain-containing protein n=1 Tax=Paenibacillus shirakamiensis TaxID=1265935 RepID=A0ABS4JN65_9BACL|nr:DUF2515 family protein [Paenibacillus shirakamiensis]MBP2002064.1 hypothetical protein [Paenibacillus shirakamiensis]